MSLDVFLNPESLKERMIFISAFIAVYENLKEELVDKVKGHYIWGLDDAAEEHANYKREVLDLVTSDKNKSIRATLLWLKNNGAITENDCGNFKGMTNIRNKFAHDMLHRFFETTTNEEAQTYSDMMTLYRKFTVWWYREIEAPISGDFTFDELSQILDEEIVAASVAFCDLMADIAFTGNSTWFETYKKQVNINDSE